MMNVCRMPGKRARLKACCHTNLASCDPGRIQSIFFRPVFFANHNLPGNGARRCSDFPCEVRIGLARYVFWPRTGAQLRNLGLQEARFVSRLVVFAFELLDREFNGHPADSVAVIRLPD